MLNRSRVGELLLKAKVIDEFQLRSAMARHDQWGGLLSATVSEMGFASEESVYSALAKALRLELVRPKELACDDKALAKLDSTFADQHMVFPVALKDSGKTLILAMADPTDVETVDEAGRRSRARVTLVVASHSEIRQAISRHYYGHGPAGAAAPTDDPGVTLPPSDDEEFKVTDMSGNTLIKRVADIKDPKAATRNAQPPAPASPAPQAPQAQAAKSAPTKAPRPAPAPARLSPAAESAAAMLDEMFADLPEYRFTEEELRRIEAVRANQDKSARLVQALSELLTEKGLLS